MERFPRFSERDRLGDGVQLLERDGDACQRLHTDGHGHAFVALRVAIEEQDVLRSAIERIEGIVGIVRIDVSDVLWIGVHLHLVDQFAHPGLVSPHPRSANRNDRSILERLVPHAAADAVTRLEHHHALSSLQQVPCGRQSGKPRTDDTHIGFALFHDLHLSRMKSIVRPEEPAGNLL